MQTKTLFTAALMAGVCALALTACSSMNTAWSDITGDDTPYAGDVPQPQPSATPPTPSQAAAESQMMQQNAMQQPMMPANPVQPVQTQQTMMQPMYQPPMPQQAMAQPMYQPQPMYQQTTTYTPNLASVPPRPMAAEIPSPQQVQATRADLIADNRMTTGYLRDLSAPTTAYAAPMPMGQAGMMPMQPGQIQSNAASMGIPPGTPLQTSATPNLTSATRVVQTGQTVMTTQSNYTGPATMMTSADQLMGLQTISPGHYALTPVAPESSLGGFSLASSLTFPPNSDQISMPQYQELRHVAGEYAQQPGRVRVIAYGDPANSQAALQRATTTAAYLVDLGVPANAIRVKVDSAATPAPGYGMPMSKTDIFLETPQPR